MGLYLALRIAGEVGIFPLTNGTQVSGIIVDNYVSGAKDDDTEWVTDEIRLVMHGTLAQIRGWVSDIERYLTLAREFYQQSDRSAVNLYGYLDPMEGLYGAQIRDGYLSRPNYDLLSGNAMSATLFLERRNHFTGSSVFVNPSRGSETGPLEISACNDGQASGHGFRFNYLDFDLTNVSGDLPAKFETTLSPGGASHNIGRLMIFHGVMTSGIWSHNHENQGSGTQTAGTAAHGGLNYVRLTLGGTYQTITVSESSNAPANYRVGSEFAIVGHFPTLPSVALSYYISSLDGSWSGPKKTGAIPNKLSMIGTVRPSLYTGLFGPALLNIKAADGSAQTLDADFFQTLPLNGWIMADVNYSGSSTISIRSEVNGQTVFSNGAPVEGPGILLWPGRVNRLHFLWDRTDRSYNANDYMTLGDPVVFNVTPRRRML